MTFLLQGLLALVGLCLACWLISVMAVLLTPLPSDPWRGQPLQANGEYIRVSDGAELFVRHWLPIGETRQVILALHGLGQHSGYHHRFGAHLAETGRAYFALDLRGNGLTRTVHGDVPSIERLYTDVDEIVRILRRRYPQVPAYVLGHSMGGAMVATWAAERQPEIDGLLILSPAMTAAVTPLPWLNYLKGPAAWLFFPHRPVLSIDETAYARGRLNAIINMPTEVEFIAKDSLHLQRMSMQFALAANRFRNKAIALASQIQVPTLTLVGKADPACFGAQQFYEALTVPDKTFILVPDVGHMVFQIKEMPRVIDEVLVWLQAHR